MPSTQARAASFSLFPIAAHRHDSRWMESGVRIRTKTLHKPVRLGNRPRKRGKGQITSGVCSSGVMDGAAARQAFTHISPGKQHQADALTVLATIVTYGGMDVVSATLRFHYVTKRVAKRTEKQTYSRDALILYRRKGPTPKSQLADNALLKRRGDSHQ